MDATDLPFFLYLSAMKVMLSQWISENQTTWRYNVHSALQSTCVVHHQTVPTCFHQSDHALFWQQVAYTDHMYRKQSVSAHGFVSDGLYTHNLSAFLMV